MKSLSKVRANVPANVRRYPLLGRPYVWRWHTTLPNIRYMWSDLTGGIRNLIRWAPLVWHDRWYDSAYMLDIMEYKLRVMSGRFAQYGNHVGSERHSRQMKICAELCKRISENNYPVHGYFSKQCPALYQRQADMKYLGLLLGKHALSWWD